MTILVNPKNKKEEKIIKAIMQSLDISFHTEEDEDAALQVAMQEGRNLPLLNQSQKENLLKKLRNNHRRLKSVNHL